MSKCPIPQEIVEQMVDLFHQATQEIGDPASAHTFEAVVKGLPTFKKIVALGETTDIYKDGKHLLDKLFAAMDADKDDLNEKFKAVWVQFLSEMVEAQIFSRANLDQKTCAIMTMYLPPVVHVLEQWQATNTPK